QGLQRHRPPRQGGGRYRHHHLPSGGHGENGLAQRSLGGGGRPTARVRVHGLARGGRLGDAHHHFGQHQHPHHHDRRKRQLLHHRRRAGWLALLMLSLSKRDAVSRFSTPRRHLAA